MARRMSFPSFKSPVWMRSRVPRAPAPPMAIIDRRRENRAESLAVIPVMRPAVMVMPLRDVPGIRARVWARPMNRAFRIVNFSIVFVLGA